FLARNAVGHIPLTLSLPLEGGGNPLGRHRASAPSPLEGEGWGGGYHYDQPHHDQMTLAQASSASLARRRTANSGTISSTDTRNSRPDTAEAMPGRLIATSAWKM